MGILNESRDAILDTVLDKADLRDDWKEVGFELVHLTEHSPTAERVLKAALRWFDGDNPRMATLADLRFMDAIRAHLEATKGKP